MKCLAIDDEPLALAQLSEYISRVPFLSLVKSCHDAFEAMDVLAREEVDLIFVDINMPDLNGLDFVRSLVVKPLIVFTTAYSEYAVEGFKADAVDYLLKPFEFQDLLKAADKARKQYEYRRMDQGDTETTSQVRNGSLFVKSEYRVVRIDKLEERLPAQQFMRVHRSYIVNLHKITEISRLRIIFNGNTYIPVGENYKERFTQYIEKLM